MVDTSKWQVIIVEDIADIAQVAAKILRSHQIEAHIATSAQECLSLLNSISPTLILTDLAMPGMDGWELLGAIRTNEATAHIPVVAMTAYHSEDVAKDVMEAGFDAYFPKPLDAASFVAKLTNALRVNR